MAWSWSNWILWLFAAAALVLSTVLISLFKKSGITRNGQPLRKPPNTLPIVGNGILFLRPRQTLFDWFVKCERVFGRETFELYVPSLPPGVVINDPRNLEFIFKNEGIIAKGDFMKKPLWDLFGHGIINADGELWKVQRKAGLAFLTAKNLQVLTDVALPRYLAQSIDELKARSEASREADLQLVFLELTSQLMGKMAYNMEMHADDSFTKAFDHASGATAERVQNPLWPLTEILFGASMRKSIAIVKAFGKRIVDSAVEDRASRAQQSKLAPEIDKLDEISGTLIQSLLDAIGDRDMVADSALNYLSAGRDTTAQALTWTFHHLLQHRYVYAKVRTEVETLLADSNSQPTNTPLFTPTALPYTHAVLNESLRLHPPIPIEIKQTQAPIVLPADNTHLPAHSVIVWCPWAMNRSPLTWGPDPDTFRPERWLTADSTTNNNPPTRMTMRSHPAPHEFPVFNGGARTCLGKRMAELVAVQVIAAVVWTFDFVPVYEGRERRSKSSLTLPMDGGLPVFVKVRNRAAGDGP